VGLGCVARLEIDLSLRLAGILLLLDRFLWPDSLGVKPYPGDDRGRQAADGGVSSSIPGGYKIWEVLFTEGEGETEFGDCFQTTARDGDSKPSRPRRGVGASFGNF
jgi:hypothetical protein